MAALVVSDAMASALIGLRDVCGLASAIAEQAGIREAFTCELVSPDGGEVTCFAGETIETRPIGRADVLVVPPILRQGESVLDQPDGVFEAIREAARAGRLVASVCTGAFLLARVGLLDDREATTSHFMVPTFRRLFPNVVLRPEKRLVAAADYVCAGATTSYLNLAVHLVERWAGHDIALEVARLLMVDLNAGLQLPYVSLAPLHEHDDELVRQVQRWIESNFAGDVSMERLCKVGGLSKRSLARRFRNATGDSPQEYARRMRVESGKRLLESTSLNIEEITVRVGYEDSRSFARLFRRSVGTSPAAYRRRFGKNVPVAPEDDEVRRVVPIARSSP